MLSNLHIYITQMEFWLQKTGNSGKQSLLTVYDTGQTQLPCPGTFCSAQEGTTWS